MIDVILRRDDSSPMLVDVSDPDQDSFDFIKTNFGLPDILLKDCLDPMHLPKLEKADGITFIIVRAYDQHSDPTEDCVQAMTRKLALFIGDRFLVAVHRKELAFLEPVFSEYRQRKDQIYLQLVMLDILLAAVETYHMPLEKAEIDIHQYEISMLRQPNVRKDWEQVFITKSRLMVIKRMLWHILNSVQKFVPHTSTNLPAYQDLKERIESLHFFADSLLDNLNNLLNIQISLSSNTTNEIIRVLTLFSVVFMPLTFIVGIYGMNFENMPEIKSPYGYGAVWAVMLITAIAIYFWFRKRGWLR